MIYCMILANHSKHWIPRTTMRWWQQHREQSSFWCYFEETLKNDTSHSWSSDQNSKSFIIQEESSQGMIVPQFLNRVNVWLDLWGYNIECGEREQSDSDIHDLTCEFCIISIHSMTIIVFRIIQYQLPGIAAEPGKKDKHLSKSHEIILRWFSNLIQLIFCRLGNNTVSQRGR